MLQDYILIKKYKNTCHLVQIYTNLAFIDINALFLDTGQKKNKI